MSSFFCDGVMPRTQEKDAKTFVQKYTYAYLVVESVVELHFT